MKKECKMYNGRYLGSMAPVAADYIESLLQATKVPNLEHSIFDLSPQEVEVLEKLPVESFDEYKVFTPGGLSSVGEAYNRGTLTDAQTVGVAFMYYAGAALLGDDVGLGKTVQVAGLINVLANAYAQQGLPFRYCFLTEQKPANQIYKKLLRFTGMPAYYFESAVKNKVEKYVSNPLAKNVSVVGTHALLNSSPFLVHSAKNRFDLIVIDESSVIKKASSGIHKNAKAFLSSSARRVLLNATPLETNCMEFYTQLSLLDSEFLPSMSAFQNEFCSMKPDYRGGNTFNNKWVISGYKNQDEFKKRISYRYLARNRSMLGAQYESNTYQCIIVPLSTEQSMLLKSTSLYAMTYDYPAAVDRMLLPTLENTPKAKVLLNLVLAEKEAGRQVLTYCKYIEAQNFLVEILKGAGLNVILLNGEMSKKEVDEVQKSITSGNFDVLVTDIQRGLDIPMVSTCIFYSIDPNPQKMVQFEGRMVRSFDVLNKNVYLLISKGREEKFVKESIVPRVEAACAFTELNRSLTVSALLNR